MNRITYTTCPLCGKKGLHRPKLSGHQYRYERCRFCRMARATHKWSYTTGAWLPHDGQWHKCLW